MHVLIYLTRLMHYPLYSSTLFWAIHMGVVCSLSCVFREHTTPNQNLTTFIVQGGWERLHQSKFNKYQSHDQNVITNTYNTKTRHQIDSYISVVTWSCLRQMLQKIKLRNSCIATGNINVIYRFSRSSRSTSAILKFQKLRSLL